MPRFTITESIAFEVEADDAQGALDAWLNAGEDAPGYQFCEVSEREVSDESGNPCEVED